MQLVQRNVRRTGLLLAVGGALLLGLAVATTILAYRAQSTFGDVVRDRELRRAASLLLTALREVEIGERGFLLTGDPAFLQPYEDAVGTVPDLQAQLAQRAADSRAEASVELDGLGALIAEKLALSAARVEAQRAAGSPDRAALLADERRGKVVMDEIRARLDGFLDRNALDFQSLLAAQQRLNWWNVLATLLASVAMLAVVGLAFATLARQLAALRHAEIELQRLNLGLEERVRTRTEDLMRANQEVQRFAYIVTHDLRAPLVNIMGFTSELEAALEAIRAYVLADGDPLSEQAIREARTATAEDLPEALGFIRASTRKMDGLINAILKISRDGRRKLRPERVDLDALARLAVDAVAHQIAEAGGSASVDVAAPAIVSDRLSIEQAVGNLVDNAVKYADPARPLRLAVSARPDGPHHVLIEVADNGRGIAPADRERVFDLFRRAGAQDRPGEGIGLAHVRSLVRNLGGEVTLRSVPGEGSTFALQVPTDLRRVLDRVGA